VALHGDKGKRSWVMPNNVNEAVECRVPLSAEDNAGTHTPICHEQHDKSLYPKQEKLTAGDKRSYSNSLPK